MKLHFDEMSLDWRHFYPQPQGSLDVMCRRAGFMFQHQFCPQRFLFMCLLSFFRHLVRLSMNHQLGSRHELNLHITAKCPGAVGLSTTYFASTAVLWFMMQFKYTWNSPLNHYCVSSPLCPFSVIISVLFIVYLQVYPPCTSTFTITVSRRLFKLISWMYFAFLRWSV